MSNFAILESINKKENFYNNNFLDKINGVFENYKNNVISPTNTSNKEKEQKRILYTYIFPLCYMIYSYIYQKFNKKQIERHLYNTNNDIYNMYNYFFDYNNPVIKKVNVYYYQRFLKDKEKLNKGNINNIYLLNDIKEEKEKVNIFFNNFLIKCIKDDNNLGSTSVLYQAIVEEFEILIKKNLYDIIKNLFKIKTNITPQSGTPSNNIITYIDKFLNYTTTSPSTHTPPINQTITNSNFLKNSSNIKLTFDSNKLYDLIIYLGSITDYNIFNLYSTEYNIIYTIFQNNILDNIRNINNFIVLLNLNNRINEKVIGLDDINLNTIFEKYRFFKTENTNISDKKKIETEIIQLISTLNKNNIVENDLYTDYFNYIQKKNNKSNNKINKFDAEITKKYNEDLKTILDILNKLYQNTISPKTLTNTLTNKNTTQFKTNFKTIEEDTNNNLYNLIQLFFMAYSINDRIENSYLKILINKPEENTSTDIKYKDIELLLDTFTIKFREYKKTKNDSKETYIENINNTQKILNDYLIDAQSEMNQLQLNKSNVGLANKITKDNNSLLSMQTDLEKLLKGNGSKNNIMKIGYNIFKKDNYDPFDTFYNNLNNNNTIITNIINNLTPFYTTNPFTSLQVTSQTLNDLINIINNNLPNLPAALPTPLSKAINIIDTEINNSKFQKDITNYKTKYNKPIPELTKPSINLFSKMKLIKDYLDSTNQSYLTNIDNYNDKIKEIKLKINESEKIRDIKIKKTDLINKIINTIQNNLKTSDIKKSDIENNKILNINVKDIISLKMTQNKKNNSSKTPNNTTTKSQNKPINISPNKILKSSVGTMNVLDIKNNFIEIFNELFKKSELMHNTIIKIKEGNSSNKLYFQYEIKNKKLNDIFKNIYDIKFAPTPASPLVESIEIEKAERALREAENAFIEEEKKSNEAKNKLDTATSRTMKLIKSSLNAEYAVKAAKTTVEKAKTAVEKAKAKAKAPTPPKSKEEVEKIVKNINDYFKDESSYQNFINIINTNISNNTMNKNLSDSIQSFFKIYLDYHNKLITKIKLLLKKINKGEYECRNIDDDHIINIFIENIVKNKKDKYEKIITKTKNNKLKNEKKGNIIYVLAYTDILFGYFIQLLIIIDFLTYFYEEKQ